MKKHMMIGLTGGIGSGKSIVAEHFAAHGITIIDADVIARTLVTPHTPALHKMVTRWGTSILDAHGELQRAHVRDRIFADPAERVWLEQLLHPSILTEIETHITQITTPYGIVVAPLLLETETPMLSVVQRILVIDCPLDLQIQRIQTRDHLTPAQIQPILAAQFTREQRLALADDVITNDGGLASLIAQVDALHQRYLALAN